MDILPRKGGRFYVKQSGNLRTIMKGTVTSMEFIILGGGLLIIILAVVISVVSSVVSAVAAEQDDAED